MTTLAWGMATHKGRVRSENQDDGLADEVLFVVADGMGGHAGGAVASRTVVEYFRDNVDPVTVAEVIDGTHRANAAVLEAVAADPSLRGMGTTLCVLALVAGEADDRLIITNVGDSRVYHFQDGELDQITQDHSLVETLLREGRLTPEEAAVHPQRNILTRALGIDEKVLVDDWAMLPFAGDRYVLCSDGLFNEVTDNEIAGVLRRLADPQEAADELVRLANDAGGRDNITVVVVDVDDDDGRAVRAAALQERAALERLAAHHSSVPDPSVLAELRATTRADTDDEPMRVDRRGLFTVTSLPPMTWRVLMFAGVVMVVVAVSIGSLVAYARNSYYVGLGGAGDTEVVIYKGRPGGVLWFDETVHETTDLRVVDLPSSRFPQVEAGHTTGSLDEARAYVAALADEIEQLATEGGEVPSTVALPDVEVPTSNPAEPTITIDPNAPPDSIVLDPDEPTTLPDGPTTTLDL